MDATELQERLTRLGHHLDAERAARTGAASLSGAEQRLSDSNGGPAELRPTAGLRPSALLRPSAGPGLGLGRAAAIVAVVAIGAIGVAVAIQTRPAPNVELSAQAGETAVPVGVPEGAPAPGTVAPFVESPPVWFGEPRAGRRPAADRTGHWVSTAIGRAAGSGTVSSPIWIGATTGSLRDLSTADTIVIGTETFRLLDLGTGWRALATIGQPTVVATGEVGTELLAEVLDATHVELNDGEITLLALDPLPDQYTRLLRPQEHAPDVAERRTLTNATGDIALNETSDWVQPQLAAAATGVTYQAIPVGDTTGWTGRTDLNPYGPVTFLIWSPQPGVVLEIGSTNDDRSIDDLVELAMNVELLPSEVWDSEVPAAGN